MINSSLKTTIDVKRQTRNLNARANLLIRNFRYCTDDSVKCYCFRPTALACIVECYGLTQLKVA